MRKRTLSAGLALAALVSASAVARVESDRDLRFDVFLDERPIGTQRFTLQELPGGLRVETRAELALELLRVRVFAYDHENVEQWRGGCLESIQSRTNSNGTPYRVTGSALPDGFRVESQAGEQRLDDCVGTFSYWDKDQLLQRARLLNAQTGEYVPVRVRALGTGRLALAGGDVAVERYALEGDGLSITLAYAIGSGEWVGLDSRVAGGRTLKYRRSAGEAGALATGASGGEAAR